MYPCIMFLVHKKKFTIYHQSYSYEHCSRQSASIGLQHNLRTKSFAQVLTPPSSSSPLCQNPIHLCSFDVGTASAVSSGTKLYRFCISEVSRISRPSLPHATAHRFLYEATRDFRKGSIGSSINLFMCGGGRPQGVTIEDLLVEASSCVFPSAVNQWPGSYGLFWVSRRYLRPLFLCSASCNASRSWGASLRAWGCFTSILFELLSLILWLAFTKAHCFRPSSAVLFLAE